MVQEIISGNYENCRTYGGKLYDSDFSTSYVSTRSIASRIAEDFRFDKKCKNKMEVKKNAKI